MVGKNQLAGAFARRHIYPQKKFQLLFPPGKLYSGKSCFIIFVLDLLEAVTISQC